MSETRPRILPAVAFAFLAFPVSVPAQFGFALSPMRSEINVVAGTQRTGILTLANVEDLAARFRTEILDVSIDNEAVPQFEKDIPSEAGYSCKQWFVVNPMESELPAASQSGIRYTFHVPPGAPPRTYHCAVGFTSMKDAKAPQTSQMGIAAQLRLTCTFYLTVGKPAPAGTISTMTVQRLDRANITTHRLVFEIHNAGSTNLRGAGSIDFLGPADEVLQTIDFPSIAIYPNRNQLVPVMLPSTLPDGDYRARARVNLGTGEVQEAILGFRLPAVRQ